MSESCQNCGAGIGSRETPFVWNDQVVCRQCHNTLSMGPSISVYRDSEIKPQPPSSALAVAIGIGFLIAVAVVISLVRSGNGTGQDRIRDYSVGQMQRAFPDFVPSPGIQDLERMTTIQVTELQEERLRWMLSKVGTSFDGTVTFTDAIGGGRSPTITLWFRSGVIDMHFDVPRSQLNRWSAAQKGQRFNISGTIRRITVMDHLGHLVVERGRIPDSPFGLYDTSLQRTSCFLALDKVTITDVTD